MHNINTLITYNYIWFAATCFDVNTASSGRSSCLAKITYIVDLDKMELLRSIMYVILASHEELPEHDVLTSKHVGANHM